MFYPDEVRAPKVPLRQIWMAATMRKKINRKKLNDLNIIKICEEILDPPVPRALRLNGILMAGVVIVYERKVKFLYADVDRFRVELNKALKVKSVPDRTLLPKGKSQAKYKAVTLPYNNQEAELGEIEESPTNTRTMMGFQQIGYIDVGLDNVDEPYINNNNPSEKDQSEQYHQADAANITLFDSYQTDTRPYHHFERFDIEGDNETQLNFNSQEDTQIPIPSPPRPPGPQKPDAANIALFDSYQTDTRPYHHFERFDIEGDNETQLNFNSQEDTQIPIPSPPRPPGPQKPDAANIALFDSYQTDTRPYHHFERFDIEGDNETQLNFNSQEDTQIPIPSPPRPPGPQKPDAANIALFDSYQTDTRPYHHFERFDIEGDNETQLNFNSQEDTQIPIPSPPRPPGPQKPDEILDQHPEDQVNQQSNKQKEAIQPQQDHQRQGPTRRKARRPAASAMDYERTIIPNKIYKSWLRSTSDIVRKRKIHDAMSTMEIGNPMELPPVALICGLSTTGNREIHYPAPLLEQLWRISTIPTRDLPSGRKSPPQPPDPPQPPEPSSSSPPDRAHYTDPLGFPSEDFHSGLGSQSRGKLWANLETHEIPTEVFIPGLSNNLGNNSVRVNEANVMVPPGNSGDEIKSIPSSGSGHGFLSFTSACPFTSAWFPVIPSSGSGHDLLVETGPTQTQQPIFNPPIDLMTDSIQMTLKTHFDTPGTSQTESLNELAFGWNKNNAAHLFYQTCVLASRDVIRVEQEVPYGDILISRGLNM